MDNLLGLTAPAPLSLTTLAINLLLSIILSSGLAWFYAQYGKSLSNRSKFAQGLPVLAMTTVLVISIVKSSLALSLVLVGALSIVRFRTAIKEPEELLYLFIAIAIGLGMGADQRLPTVLAVMVVLVYLFIRALLVPRVLKNNLYLNVAAPASDGVFAKLNDLLAKYVKRADLRRLDGGGADVQATYLIACPDEEALAALMDDLRVQLPGCEYSFVEQDNSLGG